MIHYHSSSESDSEEKAYLIPNIHVFFLKAEHVKHLTSFFEDGLTLENLDEIDLDNIPLEDSYLKEEEFLIVDKHLLNPKLITTGGKVKNDFVRINDACKNEPYKKEVESLSIKRRRDSLEKKAKPFKIKKKNLGLHSESWKRHVDSNLSKDMSQLNPVHGISKETFNQFKILNQFFNREILSYLHKIKSDFVNFKSISKEKKKKNNCVKRIAKSLTDDDKRELIQKVNSLNFNQVKNLKSYLSANMCKGDTISFKIDDIPKKLLGKFIQYVEECDEENKKQSNHVDWREQKRLMFENENKLISEQIKNTEHSNDYYECPRSPNHFMIPKNSLLNDADSFSDSLSSSSDSNGEKSISDLSNRNTKDFIRNNIISSEGMNDDSSDEVSNGNIFKNAKQMINFTNFSYNSNINSPFSLPLMGNHANLMEEEEEIEMNNFNISN